MAALQSQLAAALEEGFAAQRAADAAKERAEQLQVRLGGEAAPRAAEDGDGPAGSAPGVAPPSHSTADAERPKEAAAPTGGMRRGEAADEVAALAGKLARSQQQLRTLNLQVQQLKAENARWVVPVRRLPGLCVACACAWAHTGLCCRLQLPSFPTLRRLSKALQGRSEMAAAKSAQLPATDGPGAAAAQPGSQAEARKPSSQLEAALAAENLDL